MDYMVDIEFPLSGNLTPVKARTLPMKIQSEEMLLNQRNRAALIEGLFAPEERAQEKKCTNTTTA